MLVVGDNATNDLSGGFEVFHACASGTAFIEKLNPSGQPVWSSFIDHAAQAVVASAGGPIYVVGTKPSATFGDDLWVSRIGDMIRLGQFSANGGTAQFGVDASGLPGWSIVVERTDSLAIPFPGRSNPLR